MKKLLLLLLFCAVCTANAQQSVARQWNEVLLDAIRSDYARPTVHARNLYHSSVLMYDAWALFDNNAQTVFLGQNYGGYDCRYNGILQPGNVDSARQEIMSYALFRLLTHRFSTSPGATETLNNINELFSSFGYDPQFTSTDYSNGSYAALGNYLGNEMIAFGRQDGANENFEYGNQLYEPLNPPLVLAEYQDITNIDPNHWQPLSFDLFIDQSGNSVPVAIPDFLGPEWGAVVPFALDAANLQIKNNGFDSHLYFDTEEPPQIENSMSDGINDPYKWNFTLVAAWSAHLDPEDATEIDISPAGLGNVSIDTYPTTFDAYRNFYDLMEGGDIGQGWNLNPYTNQPYAPQFVKRSDYTRVLAEFWADGPDSETPPGHWYTILNYVSDHPLVSKKFKGEGPTVNDLEWDVKSYLALGGAMHDSAIATWGIKGHFDYVRPISAIRYMSGKGQSSDSSLPNFDPQGIPLIPDLIELIDENDPLAGNMGELVGEIKIKAWRGPDFINDPENDVAGVGWILGTHWWPYQRGTFVTPPFAGYVSGHSTFSRAAAEIMTQLTGDAFFPGGMGTFDIKANQFLVFEDGPSEDFTLQWATYRDASDQTSLSRIWGGIHPPIDDIPGRLIGDEIGKRAFAKAERLFGAQQTSEKNDTSAILFPIPFQQEMNLTTDLQGQCTVQLFNMNGELAHTEKIDFNASSKIDTSGLSSGVYVLTIKNNEGVTVHRQKVIRR
ncbi:T9SS C-terminal target domain-containing protein [Zobellia amurskyensis]|uniref:T9SS C-terminal target domain-containing protein n=1 Tax=Zobellia amurskyensis TaxID=248905 RepID=A0A7X3D2D1_9FLAO|nr:T9SS type A sorting domain-containing protein [Zobellia amurskyensis]MUH37114.1 T9SS C-terminal target domain-containing protein [Zobellia amurskyensis]